MREKETATRSVVDRTRRADKVGHSATIVHRAAPIARAARNRIMDDVPGTIAPEAVLALQRTVGNRVAGQILDARPAAPTPRNVTSTIIQPMRARVQGTNLSVDVTKVPGKPHTFVDKTTGQLYRKIPEKTMYGGSVVVPLLPTKKKRPYGKLRKDYKKWRKTQNTGKPIKTPYGPVTARHNRGAPYITSKATDYKNVQLGDTYAEFIRGLRGSGKATDAEIAKDLLSGKSDAIKEELQKRAAAMIMASVHLAEQWRKHGAVKIFNAILRRVAAGAYDLDSIPTRFAFVASAKQGRQQVGRFQDQYEKQGKLDKAEKKIYDDLSDIEDDDFSSDDDMRDEKEIASKRLYAKKHKT